MNHVIKLAWNKLAKSAGTQWHAMTSLSRPTHLPVLRFAGLSKGQQSLTSAPVTKDLGSVLRRHQRQALWPTSGDGPTMDQGDQYRPKGRDHWPGDGLTSHEIHELSRFWDPTVAKSRLRETMRTTPHLAHSLIFLTCSQGPPWMQRLWRLLQSIWNQMHYSSPFKVNRANHLRTPIKLTTHPLQ